MKKWTIAKWSLALAALPFVGGCAQESANSAPAVGVATNQAEAAGALVVTNAPEPAVAEQELENAPGKIVSVAQPPAQSADLTTPAAEIAKLAQSGVDENVLLAFITNSPHTFNLGSDQIIYLNDIGVPGNVVAAMIQHDQSFQMASAAQPAAPVYVNPPVAVTPVEPEAVEAQPPVLAESAPPPQVNVTSTYFYDSLAPYGNWIEIEGYGRCWQPSVVVANRDWQPYGDRGRWVYSDCGWYWASDYSWGWAPFHYGRWFRHNFWGWCWAPDTVWGPSWVSWRSSPGYCGWAPLPPTACYRPGLGFSYYGRSVGVSFNFGLGVDCFTFVPTSRFCDSRPYHHRVPRNHVTQIFNDTTIINPVIEERGHSRFHKGIPVGRISEATRTEIKPVRIHETAGTAGNNRHERFDRNHDSLTVYRPRLPEPPAHSKGNRVGEGVRPAAPNLDRPRVSDGLSMRKGIPQRSQGTVNSPTLDRHERNVQTANAPIVSPRPTDVPAGNSRGNVNTVPSFGNRQPRQENAHPGSNNRETPLNSLIVRGRPATSTPSQAPAPTSPVTQPRTPVQNNLLVNRQHLVVPQPSTVTPAESRKNSQQRDTQMLRQETPRVQPPAARVFTQPAPVQRQPEARVYQPAPPTLPREQRGSFNPAPQRVAPAVRSQPIVPAAPRVEMRPAPPAPVSQPAVQNGNNNSSRDNRQSGKKGRDHQ